VSAERLAPRVYRVTVIVRNDTEPSESTSRDEMLMRSLASAHAVLGVRRGEFASLTDPPPELRASASSCKNVGCWPVLVGEANRA
jgi:hydrogenase maturation protease